MGVKLDYKFKFVLYIKSNIYDLLDANIPEDGLKSEPYKRNIKIKRGYYTYKSSIQGEGDKWNQLVVERCYYCPPLNGKKYVYMLNQSRDNTCGYLTVCV